MLWTPGKTQTIADALSRFPVFKPEEDQDILVCSVLVGPSQRDRPKRLPEEIPQRDCPKRSPKEIYQRDLPKSPPKETTQRDLPKSPPKETTQRDHQRDALNDPIEQDPALDKITQHAIDDEEYQKVLEAVMNNKKLNDLPRDHHAQLCRSYWDAINHGARGC